MTSIQGRSQFTYTEMQHRNLSIVAIYELTTNQNVKVQNLQWESESLQPSDFWSDEPMQSRLDP